LSLIMRTQGGSPAEVGGIADELTRGASLNIISAGDYLTTQFRVIVTYIRLLFLPINQNLDYDYPIYKTFFTPGVFFSFVFLLLIFAGGVYLLYRSFRNTDIIKSQKTVTPAKAGVQESSGGTFRNIDQRYWYRLIAFGIFWFFVTISVESSIIPIADVIFEHRLYLPSVGFFMAVMAVVMWFTGRWGNKPLMKKAVLVALILIVVLLSATAYARNGVWKDEVTLWEDVVKKSPNKARPIYNMGILYSKMNRLDEAIILYQKAIVIKPDFYRAHNDLGNAYFNKKRFDDALREYQTAVTLNPDFAEPHNNIGIIYAVKGLYEHAISQFQIAIKLKPDYADAYANLGNAYYQQGRFQEAIIQYNNALKLNPDQQTARSNLTNLIKSGFVK
jgi:tetratricopeptide (TPR) repeat protein